MRGAILGSVFGDFEDGLETAGPCHVRLTPAPILALLLSRAKIEMKNRLSMDTAYSYLNRTAN